MVCGQDHSLFLTEDGAVYGCGWGADGQTGMLTADCNINDNTGIYKVLLLHLCTLTIITNSSSQISMS